MYQVCLSALLVAGSLVGLMMPASAAASPKTYHKSSPHRYHKAYRHPRYHHPRYRHHRHYRYYRWGYRRVPYWYVVVVYDPYGYPHREWRVRYRVIRRRVYSPWY